MGSNPNNQSIVTRIISMFDSPTTRTIFWDIGKNVLLFAGAVILMRSGMLDSNLIDTTPVNTHSARNNDHYVLQDRPYPRTKEPPATERDSPYMREYNQALEESEEYEDIVLEQQNAHRYNAYANEKTIPGAGPR